MYAIEPHSCFVDERGAYGRRFIQCENLADAVAAITESGQIIVLRGGWLVALVLLHCVVDVQAVRLSEALCKVGGALPDIYGRSRITREHTAWLIGNRNKREQISNRRAGGSGRLGALRRTQHSG